MSIPPERLDGLTTLRIGDNSQGRHSKRNFGVAMHCKGFPPDVEHRVPTTDDHEILPGQIDRLDISKDGHECLSYYCWYSEFVNGQWVYTPKTTVFNAPAGTYFPTVGLAWRAGLTDSEADVITVVSETIPLKS